MLRLAAFSSVRAASGALHAAATVAEVPMGGARTVEAVCSTFSLNRDFMSTSTRQHGFAADYHFALHQDHQRPCPQTMPFQFQQLQSCWLASSGNAGFAKLAFDDKVELHMGLRKEALHQEVVAKEYSKELSYSPEYAESVKPIHKPPTKLSERLAYNAIQATRSVFDWATGYKHDVPQTEAQWLRRVIFLETVAGVPGMVGGMLRHLRSLRVMKRDQGWIHMLLEEAENERMHLLTFMEMRNPGFLFRMMVILAQGVYFNMFFISYLVSPKFCHAIVGYLEEEAVKTYTHLIDDIDAGRLWKDKPAPATGISYWKLSPDAKMRDLILAVRADEACHSHVNHRLSEISQDQPNPFDVMDATNKK